MMDEAANPVHMISGPDTRWSTVNLAEAVPGVQLPLSWSYWGHACEAGGRGGLAALGIYSPKAARLPQSPDDRMIGIFHGRVAANIGQFRLIGDCMPGSSGDEVERGLLGADAHVNDREGTPRYDRYPAVIAKLPRALFIPRTLPGMRERYARWWRDRALDHPPSNLDTARHLMTESMRLLDEAMARHTVTTMLATALLDALTDLARRANGDEATAADLATGYGNLEEIQLMRDLDAASRGLLEPDQVVRRHGFHGPREGDLSCISWREDRKPLDTMIEQYRRRPVTNRFDNTRQARRDNAEAAVLAALPAARRPAARAVMRLARHYIPLREVGKATFLHAIDGARTGARAAGRDLAAQRLIDDPEDVFLLTYEEVLAPPPDAHELITERRTRHQRYLTTTVPQTWTGQPEPLPTASDRERPSAVRGLGVSGGTVTGRARVIHDPSGADLDSGDILVCAITDPSWTPLFLLADAVVIDIGGAMSHGAIVARELGITCVINTRTGTCNIPDGATVTVDGARGTVEVHQ